MSLVMNILGDTTGLRQSDLRRLILTAPNRYKVYTIPKKNGGRRRIAQPSKAIKFLQAAFIEHFIASLPIHPAATAYRAGLSTRDNVLPHAKNGPILKMDLRDFFPSIKAGDWRKYCKQHNIFYDEYDIYLTEQLLFYKEKGSHILRLSVGAPSSPTISNVLMFDFDTVIANTVAKDRVTYTRYADDLTFSAPRTGYLVNVIKDVAKIIRKLEYPSLDINSDKTTYITKKYHRAITGLTISNDGRVTLGRNKKREIRAAIYNWKKGILETSDIKKLGGLIAYAKSVEPDYFELLEKSNGHKMMREIRQQAARLSKLSSG